MSSTVEDVGGLFGADVYGTGQNSPQTMSPYQTVIAPTMTANTIDASQLTAQQQQAGLIQQQQSAAGYNAAIQSGGTMSPALQATLMGNNLANSQQNNAANTQNLMAQTNYGAAQYNASALNSAASANLNSQISTNSLNANNYNTAMTGNLQSENAYSSSHPSAITQILGGASNAGASYLLGGGSSGGSSGGSAGSTASAARAGLILGGSSDDIKQPSDMEGTGQEGTGPQTDGQNSTDMFTDSDAMQKHLESLTPVSFKYQPGESIGADADGNSVGNATESDPNRLGVTIESLKNSPFADQLIKTDKDGNQVVDTGQLATANAAAIGHLSQKHDELIKMLSRGMNNSGLNGNVTNYDQAYGMQNKIGSYEMGLANAGLTNVTDQMDASATLNKQALTAEGQTIAETKAIRNGFNQDYTNLQQQYPSLTYEQMEANYSPTKQSQIQAGKVLAAFYEGFTGRTSEPLAQYYRSLDQQNAVRSQTYDRGLAALQEQYKGSLEGQGEKINFIQDMQKMNQQQMTLAADSANKMLQIADTPAKVAQAKTTLFTTMKPFQIDEQKMALDKAKLEQERRGQLNSLLMDPGTMRVNVPTPQMNKKGQIIGYQPQPMLVHINNKEAQDRISKASAQLPMQLEQIAQAENELADVAGDADPNNKSRGSSSSTVSPQTRTRVAMIVSTLSPELQKLIAPQLDDYITGTWGVDNPEKLLPTMQQLKNLVIQNLRGDISTNGMVIPGMDTITNKSDLRTPQQSPSYQNSPAQNQPQQQQRNPQLFSGYMK